MTGLIHRYLENQIKVACCQFPCIAIVGPRQCGKSTFARHFWGSDSALHLDLELPSDLAKLADAETFLSMNASRTICIDEIQRRPDLFPVLRALIDKDRRPARFVILGSAAPTLLKQSSESLAGRIFYAELSPFSSTELGTGQSFDEKTRQHFVRGGFPLSFLAASDTASLLWRQQFIKTYLEQDFPQLGIRIPAPTLYRFLQMCAHSNGGTINLSKFADSMGVSHTTIRSYIDILQSTFLLRTIPACETNLKKRLIKAPKVYLRDTGILTSLLSIKTFDDFLGHPACGTAWETFCIESILQMMPDWRESFYRTQSGNELDLVLEQGSRRFAFEFKLSAAPKISEGFWRAIEDLQTQNAWVVAPVEKPYQLAKNVMVTNLVDALQQLKRCSTTERDARCERFVLEQHHQSTR